MNIDGMHWKQIKKLVEDNGGTYESREHAAEFLLNIKDDTEGESGVQVQPITNITLDKDRPYGEVFGGIDNLPGARFVQDGRYFNATGQNVG